MSWPIAYYNEIDPKAAAWLRELIERGLIADGNVDTRSIADVQPDDVRPYRQCHLFAGIGGWSLALRMAGWPDDRPVWTGSCPCQPFSSAGRQEGEADARHLWPQLRRLIAQCRPPVCFGEQVASRLGREWLAGVRVDLEALAYGVGAADLCAAGEGSPHIRQRLWWMAHRAVARREWGWHGGSGQPAADESGRLRKTVGMADEPTRGFGISRGASGLAGHPDECGEVERLANDGSERRPIDQWGTGAGIESLAAGCSPLGRLGHRNIAGSQGRTAMRRGADQRTAGPTGLGGWESFDLLPCRDGKVRRVEPGSFPLAHGVPARVVRLRGYGNAIVPQVAATFIRAAVAAIGGGQ